MVEQSIGGGIGRSSPAFQDKRLQLAWQSLG